MNTKPYAKTGLMTWLIVASGCKTLNQTEDQIKNSQRIPANVKLINSMPEGIFVLNTKTREIRQIFESNLKGGDYIKYGFARNDADHTFTFVYSPEGGADKGKIKSFALKKSDFSVSEERELNIPVAGYYNGPANCGYQNRFAFVKIGEDRTSILTLESDGKLKTLFSQEKRLAADLSCESLKDGVVYSSFECTSSKLTDCFSKDNTTTAVFRIASDGRVTQLTFPANDPIIKNSPRRPTEHHLGDVDARIIETRQGSFLSFQRLFTTTDMYSSNDDSNAEYVKQGYHASYFKILGSLESPEAKEYRLDFDSFFQKKWFEDRGEQSQLRSIYFTSDLKLVGDQSEKIQIVIGASLKAGKKKWDGLVTGDFKYTGLDEKTSLEVDNIQTILGLRELSCGLWNVTDTSDGFYLHTTQFPRFLDDDHITFVSVRKLMIPPEDIVEIDGKRYLKKVIVNGKPIDVETWKELFCGHDVN